MNLLLPFSDPRSEEITVVIALEYIPLLLLLLDCVRLGANVENFDNGRVLKGLTFLNKT